MANYESTVTINVPASTLFDYLSDVANLPSYFPRVTSARMSGGEKVDVTATIEKDGESHEVQGEAWIRVEEAGKKLVWGAQGPNNYEGQVDIDPAGDDSCTASVRISTDRESDQIQTGVDEAAQGIKKAAEESSA